MRASLLVLAALLVVPAAPVVVRVAAINQTATNWAIYSGLATGAFSDAGLDLRFDVSASSAALVDALANDRVEVGHMAAGNVVEAVDGGRDLCIVMGVNRPLFSLVAHRRVTRVEELRGARLGVDNSRTGYVHLLKTVLERAGLHDGDYQIRDVGGVDARYDALLAGTLDAALLSVPRDLQAVAAGFHVVADVDEPASRYAGSVAVVRRAWARAHRDALVRYIRAYRTSLDWLYRPANGDRAAAVLAERLRLEPPLAAALYRSVVTEKRWLVPDASVSPAGVRAVMERMGVDASVTALDRYVDTSYYDEASRAETPR